MFNTGSYLDPFFQKAGEFLVKLPSVIVGLLIGILIVRTLTRLIKWSLKMTSLQPGIRQVFGSVIESVLWFLLSIAVLQALGFSNVLLFFTSSAAALAIVMAAGGSTLISDIFAGLFIAQDPDFKVGDRVIAGPDKTEGVIVKIDARRTRLRDDNNKIHVLPNTLVERNEWVVQDRAGEIDPLKQVRRTVRKLKSAVAEVAQTKPVAKSKGKGSTSAKS